MINRVSSDLQAQSSAISKEFENITLHDLELVATLGVGGFGRVELVSDR